MNNLVQNWKTSSAGIVLILTGLIHLGYGLFNKTITEQDFTTTMISIVTGIGLIVAGDGSKSASAHEETKQLVGQLQEQINQVKSDTTAVKKTP